MPGIEELTVCLQAFVCTRPQKSCEALIVCKMAAYVAEKYAARVPATARESSADGACDALFMATRERGSKKTKIDARRREGVGC